MASTLTFLIFFFLRAVCAAEPQSVSFSFSRFDQDPYFQSNIALSGDANVISDGSAIHLTGEATYKKPIKILQGNPSSLVSFSSHFSFSLSGGNGDELAFSMGSIGANLSEFVALDKVLVVEFEKSKEDETDHVREAQVEVNLGSLVTVRISNASSLVSYNGEILDCWIDYEAGSTMLEVRLTELGNPRPKDPMLLHRLDLSNMWKGDEVVMGLSSNRSCFIYSWSFELRRVPHWMHSQPLDPNAVSKEAENPTVTGKSNCALRVLAMMIFGTVSVALGSILVAYAVFGSRRRDVVPEGFVMKPLDCEYKKVGVVVVDKVVKDCL